MESTVAGFTFFSNFDSGNLAKVILQETDEENDEESASEKPSRQVSAETPRKSSARRQKQNSSQIPPLAATDFAFKIWTRPDCAGTEFENGNRTWFYFGFRGSPAVFVNGNGVGSKVIKFTVMNMNKQSKLFSQGMSPIILVVPQNGQVPSYHSQPNGGWERICERPTYSTTSSSEEGGANFTMSFRVLCEPNTTTYVAFTYPYTYKDLQSFLGRLEKRHGSNAEKSYEALSKCSPNSIYFHRENVCYSLEKRRIDLLTITGLNGLLPEREENLDKLFPEHGTSNEKGRQVSRPFKFTPSKKTIFVSARVHPGETQASFVMNGFLRFLLRESDPRSVALRKKYVFKLIPMLNPDGVVNGHYRTDCRGVNLNRVYGRPNFEHHPQIFAARKLLLYAHHRKEIFENFPTSTDEGENESKTSKKLSENFFLSPDAKEPAKLSSSSFSNSDEKISKTSSESNLSFRSFQTSSKPSDNDLSTLGSSPLSESLFSGVTSSTPSSHASSSTPKFLSGNVGPFGYEMTETSRFSEGDESIADFSERHGFGVAPSPQRNHLPSVGPTTFSAAFAQAATSPARRRRLSFGRDDFLSSAAKKLSNTASEDLKSSGDFHDLHQHLDDLEDANKNVVIALEEVVHQSECPNLVAQEENANLDFAGKFVQPTSASFTIPINDLLFKNKRCQLDRDEDDGNKNGGSECCSDVVEVPSWDVKTSGLFLYVDIHGHASKRGIFMYGNYFNEVETQATSMLLPKLMSINCANFDFPACNFTERNMYLKDRHTGAGREGSGRVSVYKATGLIHSYTLECNFNTGRVVNGVPMASRDAGRATPPPPPHPLPHLNPGTGTTPNATLQDQVSPKYTPEIYEDAGKALSTSLLDLTESNPWTRLTCSAFKNLRGVREWLRKYIRAAKAAENELKEEREGRSRIGRRRSTNSESSNKSGHHSKISPMKADLSSPTRSLRSSNRRMRTLSSSASAVLSASKKSSLTSGYQPESKIARKNSLPSQQQLITSNMFKVADTTSAAPSSSTPAAPAKFPSLAKTNSIQGVNTAGKGNSTTKRVPGITKRKSKRNRSASLGKIRLESQSCPVSRPGSAVAQSSRPNSPRGSTSPTSPRSPSFARRALSIGSVKCTRSRPNSPSRSGPSSPTSASTTSLARSSSLKSLKKLKKKSGVARKKISYPDEASDEIEGVVTDPKDLGSPKMTPKKKLKINQGKKKTKSKPLKRAKIIMSAASALNPQNF